METSIPNKLLETSLKQKNYSGFTFNDETFYHILMVQCKETTIKNGLVPLDIEDLKSKTVDKWPVSKIYLLPDSFLESKGIRVQELDRNPCANNGKGSIKSYTRMVLLVQSDDFKPEYDEYSIFTGNWIEK